MPQIVFLDTEVQASSGKILDVGATNEQVAVFHSASLDKLKAFINGTEFLCGHHIIEHDKVYLNKWLGEDAFRGMQFIDTLFLSALLYPERPYHRLVKDDKLDTEEVNNPYNDALKARDLFYDEVEKYRKLDPELRKIYRKLIGDSKYFSGFFNYVGAEESINDLEGIIRRYFGDRLCGNADIAGYMKHDPISLSYALALITCDKRESITPPWILHRFPDVERILFQLRSAPCLPGCAYCNQSFDAEKGLKEFFGFDSFREFEGKPLQKQAVEAALHNKSILTIFPTGGGKSLTFQVPALMAGKHAHALTVIISPLQSLMKDQVDNLEDKHQITEAVTINGMLDPIERSKAVERVKDGFASILYISPESLRSKTIENLLLGRKIARFVIDEAHCFSSWGHDFRVDYLYIGDFLKSLQHKKNQADPIPVSCFTATAKPQVIEDIRTYFREKLQLELDLYQTASTRRNLQYRVIHCESDNDKYLRLRDLVDAKRCPTIIYVSRVRRTEEIAKRLTDDGFHALPYHGKMEVQQKSINQEAFKSGETDIIVATSAFGMGVDKDNVEMVIHYDISDSLENYVQEAGRAGRKESIKAACFVLFNENDLGKHFILLNQTKMDIHEIREIWKAIKMLTKERKNMSNSALEIARKAGWDDEVADLENRVATAVAALEVAGYVKRIHNSPRIFATSILVKTAQEAIDRINESARFNERQKGHAIRIMKKLIASKSRQEPTGEVAESRVDYISDHLGIKQQDVIHTIELLRGEKILADTRDLTVSFSSDQTKTKASKILEEFVRLENILIEQIDQQDQVVHIKALNETAIRSGVASNPHRIWTLLNFWAIKNWISKEKRSGSKDHCRIIYKGECDDLSGRISRRHVLAGFVIQFLYEKLDKLASQGSAGGIRLVDFSIHELKEAFEQEQQLFNTHISIYDVEDTLFFLTRIDALTIEGGFLVVYNRLNIHREENNPRRQYKVEDYETLKNFYEHKTQQIHIVGEYAKKMLKDYQSALTFVDDYFTLNYRSFLNKYFPGSRQDEIRKTITPAQFQKLFGELTPAQLEIVKNQENQYLVVTAGPGSGKTKLLVHKLAAIVRMEDVKYEQLLMLTFSRAAVSEFKSRLIGMIGGAAHYIEIKTFHSYAFDLLGRVGDLERSTGIIKEAVEKIRSGEVEQSRIAKAVLVIDEAQDMRADEFELIQLLMMENSEMRVIAVGDDDQNIYEFRGSDSNHLRMLMERDGARQFELIENFRSRPNLVEFTNLFARTITNRLKSTEILSRHKENGFIRIFRHPSSHLEIPIVKQISTAELRGSTCIMTKSNQEAFQLAGLLRREKLPVRLIQSNDDFSLMKLREARYVLEQLGKEESHQVVSEEMLKEALKGLRERFGRTLPVNMVLKAIEQFIKLHPKAKYRSDLEIFLGESKMEDFIESGMDTIMVSTMHKAKGREFDNVFLMLNDFRPKDDAGKRVLYVAMTRAKSRLEIHYNSDFLEHLSAASLKRQTVSKTFPQPDRLSFQLTHKHVYLGYFGFIQKRIYPLNSGDPLDFNKEGCLNQRGDLVLKFSAKMKEEIEKQETQGFRLSKAKVSFIAYWYNEQEAKEYMIVLPEVEFERVISDEILGFNSLGS